MDICLVLDDGSDYLFLSTVSFGRLGLGEEMVHVESGWRVGGERALKEIISQTDYYLVILSSKTYVFEDKLTCQFY